MSDVISIEACPECGEKERREIVYGYPSEGTMKRAFRGEFELGGCVVSERSPRWCCRDCGARWGRMRF